ncbi:MAG: DUF5659 domain-containing protein [Nitrosotalea sp.]
MEYKNVDFYLSACLLAAGAPLLRLEKQSSKTFIFVFKITGKTANQIIQQHWDKSLILPTKTLIDAINELKTRLHNGV